MINKILVVSSELDVSKSLAAIQRTHNISSQQFVFLIEDFNEVGCIVDDEVHYIVQDFSRRECIAEMVSRICQRHNIVKVISSDEFSVFIAAIIREKLKLKGMNCKTAQTFRDKQLMKRIALGHGITTPREYTRDEIIIEKIHYPLVIKPRSLAGGVGVKIIHSTLELPITPEEDLDYRDMEKQQVIIESYNPSAIFHIDCIVILGKIIFLSVGAYQGTPLDYLYGHVLGCISRTDEEIFKLWRPFTEKLKTAFRFPDGVFHIEAFFSGSSEPELMEIAYRPGGGPIFHAILHAYGIDLRQMHLAIQLDLVHDLNFPNTGNSYAYLLYPKDHLTNKEKRVTCVSSLNLRSVSTLKHHHVAKIGDLASGEFHSHKDCLGMFIFSGHRESVIKDYKSIKSRYRVTLGTAGCLSL